MAAALLLLLLATAQESESASSRGLRFLARHQAEDGSWGEFEDSCRCPDRLPLETPLPIPVDEQVERRFAPLLEQLSADAAATREQAHRAIQALGSRAVPLLQRQLHHTDPEVASRCRTVLAGLWESDPAVLELRRGLQKSEPHDIRVLATGLALLCYLEVGYSHVSKVEFQDPNGRTYQYGQVVKRATRWLLDHQATDGAFSRDPVTHAVAATAMSENYGMTASARFKEPAENAMTFLKTLECYDTRFLVWAGLALHSAHYSELTGSTAESCEQLARVLAQQDSPSAAAGTLMFAGCRKKGTKELMKRVSGLRANDLSPEELLLATSAMAAWSPRGSDQRSAWTTQLYDVLRPAQVLKPGCERGSWSLEGNGRKDRLITTMYALLAMERSHLRCWGPFVPAAPAKNDP
jgi:hypothetical protein